jgi:N-acetyl-beta-hexosaminidase
MIFKGYNEAQPTLVVEGSDNDIIPKPLKYKKGEGKFILKKDTSIFYAVERYVEIIPEFDMPGYSNAALASYGFLNEDGKI